MIPAGTSIALPDSLERLMIAAGNGECLDIGQQNSAETALHPDISDLVKRVEALKLDLPDDLTYEQVKEAVEKAEQEQQSSQADDRQPSDSQLNLGRSGRAQG